MTQTREEENQASQAGIESIDPALLPHILLLDGDELLLPLRLKREDVNKVQAVKFSEEELAKVRKFQGYLNDRGYCDNTFAGLFVYLFNLAFTFHKRVADREADEEEAKP